MIMLLLTLITANITLRRAAHRKMLPRERRRSVTCSLENSYVLIGINQDSYTEVSATSLRIWLQHLPNMLCRLNIYRDQVRFLLEHLI